MEQKEKKGQRPVTQLNIQGKEQQTFPSIMEASEKTGISRTSINKCIQGQRKSAGGYRWIYADQDTQPSEERTLTLYKFPNLDEALVNIITSSKKRKKHLLIPKYLYFPHLLITAKEQGKNSKTINLETFAGIIGENNQTARRIIQDWIELGVVEIFSKAHSKPGQQQWISARYSLTAAYQNRFVSREQFTDLDGAMITNMLDHLNKEAQGEPVAPKVIEEPIQEPEPVNEAKNADPFEGFDFNTVPSISGEPDTVTVTTPQPTEPELSDTELEMVKRAINAAESKDFHKVAKTNHAKVMLKYFAADYIGTDKYDIMLRLICEYRFTSEPVAAI